MTDSSTDSFGARAARPQKAEESAQKKERAATDARACARFCTGCGSPLEPGDLFCPECGGKVEQEEAASTTEEGGQILEREPVAISPDRMASILQTGGLKRGELADGFMNSALPAVANGTEARGLHGRRSLGKRTALSGYYVHRDSCMTQYLVIESVHGSGVKASVRTTYVNGGYSTEFYEGTFSGNELHLRMVGSDLHPPPDELRFSPDAVGTVRYVIRLSEKFDGIVGDGLISGSFSGHFSKFVVFRRC